MASPLERIRYRIKEIELQPNTHKYPIVLRVLVDNREVCQLPRVERGAALQWARPIICRDVSPESEVALEITEIHTLKDKELKSQAYKISSVQVQTETSLDFLGTPWTAKVTLLVPATVDQSRIDALQILEDTKLAPGVLEKLGKVQGVFQAVLDFGNAVADAHPAAKLVFSVCTVAWDRLKENERIAEDTQALMDGMSGMVGLAVEVKKHAKLEQLKKTIEKILILLEDTFIYVLEHESKGGFRNLLKIIDSSDRDVVDGLLGRFNILQAEFASGVNVETSRIAHDLDIRSLLDSLKPAEKSDYNSGQVCQDGTREEIITNIVTWSEKMPEKATEGQCMLWIYGQAGIGKSSIATSVCKRLADRGLLAASFFCKRDAPQLHDSTTVINTIAHDLASQNPAYKKALAAAIEARPKLCTTSGIHERFKGLFKEPLKGLEGVSLSRPLVVLVDALDESGDFKEERVSLVECLSELVQLAPWLRVIVTSRPDEDIKNAFNQLGDTYITCRDVHSFDAASDILAYLTKELEPIASRDKWPNDGISQLCKMASGLFIWATTVKRFITGIKGSTLGRLNEVLMGRKLGELDSLYTEIIRHGMGDDEEDNKEVFRKCIGVIIAVSMNTPLSLFELRSLLPEEPYYSSLGPVVDSLGALLHADENMGGAIRVYHPSFADYATDRLRSGQFCVQPDDRNLDIARSCLTKLQQGLKFNICELETSLVFNDQIPDLAERVNNKINGALDYSCTFWIKHIIQSDNRTSNEEVKAFLQGPQVLYWLEALSLLKRMKVAVIGLSELWAWLQLGGGQDVRDCTMDLYRFTLAFYDAISASTPHLYISALALAPESSGVYQLKKQFPRTLIVVGGDKSWPGWLRSLSHPMSVSACSISRDSRWMVTGCSDCMVRLWDLKTGAQIGEQLIGHSGVVTSVLFSPDGALVVSGSRDNTVRVWNVTTRMPVGNPLIGHSGPVNSVAFSPDGNHIASGARDNTVRIWDIRTHMTVGELLTAHSSSVNSVAFSPHGSLIVSGSGDKTVRIWDINTRMPVGDPLVGHSSSVNSVAFSPDGSLVVSGSWDHTIRLWDVKTRMPVGNPLVGHSNSVYSVTFSPDASLIASGSEDKTVRLWDVNNRTPVGDPLVGHSSSVNSVTFSPDGQIIASGSGEKTVRIWDVKARMPVSNPLVGHSSPVASVAFSYDRSLIVSGSWDNTIRMWDVNTRMPVGDPLVGHSDSVYSVALSPDGSLIVSGSEDNTVRLWDVKTRMPVGDPLVGHSDSVYSTAFSPDASLIVSGSWDKTVRIWDVKTRLPVGDPLIGNSDSVHSVGFSPDGTLIVSGSWDKAIRIWDVKTRVPVGDPLIGHTDSVNSVAFSPDGTLIASGSLDHIVRVWDLKTRTLVCDPLVGHSDAVASVAFSPDGALVVSGSWDNTVRVWDVKTRMLICEPLVGHASSVNSIAFSPDGNLVVSGSWDRTVRMWDVKTRMPVDHTVQAHDARIEGRLSTQSEQSSSLLPTNTYCLRPLMDRDEWVTLDGKTPFLWLPTHYRRPYSPHTAHVFSSDSANSTVALDLSKLAYGTSWTDVTCDTVRQGHM